METEDVVRIVVFGPGYGESIVLYIPRLGWGVVDSCKYKKERERISRNPALDYLLKNQVERLAFIVLTHPHEDHFQGIEEIVDAYTGRIERIAYYAGTGIREYREYLAREEILGGQGLRKLARVFQAFKNATQGGARKISISEFTSIFLDNKINPVVEVFALSPSAQSLERYRDILFAAIPKRDGDFLQYVKDKDHNLVSTAIYFRVGNAVFILGSDLEIENHPAMGWEGVMNNPDHPSLSCRVVKVPHHGSITGYSDQLWAQFSVQNSPYSIITPYNRDRVPLPRAEVLSEIEKYSDFIAITSDVKYIKPKYVYSRTAVNNLKGVINWKCIPTPDQIGSVTIELSPDTGNVTKTEIHSPAYVVNRASKI